MIQELALYSHKYFSDARKSKIVIEKSRLRHSLAYRDLQKITPMQIDYPTLEDKLAHCVAYHHDSDCGSSLGANVHNIRLINCTTRKIELAAAGTKYTALSYVWGRPTGYTQHIWQQSSLDTLPEEAEKTVEDAIIVTVNMGFQFIWIDRYCINQNDSSKHHQIRQMDLIYRNAELTIVVAAGDDPHFGIPGVSTTPRRSVSLPLVGDFLFFALDHQEQALRNSHWNSRAWTYQEFRFSRRRLVFTENEASFCCCVTDLTEGSEANRCPTWQREIEGRRSYSTNRWLLSAYGGGAQPWHIADRISEYSAKDLTYPSDTLNAFSGILRAFEDLKYPVYHICGVPVLPPVSKDSNFRETTREGKNSEHVLPIRRSSSDGFIVGLCWKIKGPSTRRLSFPSWSWAGWKGLVKWHTSKHPYQSQDLWAAESGILVDVELSSGEMLAWKKFEELSYLKDEPAANVRVLYLRNVYTLKFRLRFVDLMNPWRCNTTAGKWEPGVYAQFSTHGGDSIFAPVSFMDKTFETASLKEEFECRDFTAVVLGRLECRLDYPFAIVVEGNGDATERIGHLSLGLREVFKDAPTHRKIDLGTVDPPPIQTDIRIC